MKIKPLFQVGDLLILTNFRPPLVSGEIVVIRERAILADGGIRYKVADPKVGDRFAWCYEDDLKGRLE